MTPSAGIEPGTHWWKASVLTTAPTLLLSHIYTCNSVHIHLWVEQACQMTNIKMQLQAIEAVRYSIINHEVKSYHFSTTRFFLMILTKRNFSGKFYYAMMM